ncbi:MAG: hypothetical protein J7551_11775 [Chloroflexi bacterium]|jgi:CheY-like chemotaxis protein|nr:hypothetical protein [Chloroflexota bacterium]
MAKILMVDNIPDMRRMMVDLLENLGHAVLQARDGVEGVRMAIADRPDLILLDLISISNDADRLRRFGAQLHARHACSEQHPDHRYPDQRHLSAS